MKKEAFLGAVARGARQLAQGLGSKAQAGARAMGQKAVGPAGSVQQKAWGMGRKGLQAVAKNPGAALGVAGGAGALGAGYAAGSSKQASDEIGDGIGMKTDIGWQ